MRQVLIIEDNTLKEARMKDVLRPIPGIEFKVCRSVKAAYPMLEVEPWALILLDMSFQVNPESNTEIKKKPLAGRQILQFMRARKLNRPVIVVTQHSSFFEGTTSVESIFDLDKKLKKYFPGIYQSTVYVDLANDSWHRDLITQARRAIDGR
jgi:DNA-binding response OmpR family regulator